MFKESLARFYDEMCAMPTSRSRLGMLFDMLETVVSLMRCAATSTGFASCVRVPISRRSHKKSMILLADAPHGIWLSNAAIKLRLTGSI